MGSGAMIYASFLNTGSGIEKLIAGGGVHRQTEDLVISQTYFYF
jgi:hypothetical protein